jgi:hypothetical protein
MDYPSPGRDGREKGPLKDGKTGRPQDLLA